MNSARTMLRGPRVTIRPCGTADVAPLRAAMAEESVARWWGEPQQPGQIAAKLSGDSVAVLPVVEIDGKLTP